MNFHQYGRSLKPAVSRCRYRHTPHHHPRTTNCYDPPSSKRYSHSEAAAASSHSPSEDGAGNPVNENDNRPESKNILKEDRQFAGVARLFNSKAGLRVRREIYSDRSILKPNSYDILSDISRLHWRDNIVKEHFDIPWPPATYSNAAPKARPRVKKPPRANHEARNPSRVAAHQQLFATIDAGFERGPNDWPATFYLVACTQGSAELTPTIRAASLAYLVRKFVLGGRHEDVLRLYTDIQSSWLASEQQELDSTVYFEALLDAFITKPAASHAVVAQVLDNFRDACGSFDSKFVVGRTHSFREKMTPIVLHFIATNLPLRESLPAISAQAGNIHDPRAGDSVLPQIYRNLNKSLLASHDPTTEPIKRDGLHSFYVSQSKILNDLSRIPRTAAVNTPLAKVFLDQAVTWEEVLEAKRLILDSPDRSDIITCQSTLMRSLHRLSPSTPPGSIHGRALLELVTDLRWLLNLKGCARQRGTFIGTAATIYARLGAFRALELLFDAVDASKRPYSVSATYIRETIQSLTFAMQRRAAFRQDTKQRAVDIAMRVLQLHIVCVSRSLRERAALQAARHLPARDHLHQGLVRDLVRLLILSGTPGAIRDVWRVILWITPRGTLDRSTLEVVLDGLLTTGDVFHAMEILKNVPATTGGRVTESTIRPFLTAAVAPPDPLTNADIPLDDVVRIGIQSKVQWGSVAHIYSLRNRGDSDGGVLNRRVEVWAQAVQGCADEITHERQQPGTLIEETLVRVEDAFREDLAPVPESVVAA